MKTVQFTKLRFIFIALSIILIVGGAIGTVIRGGFNLGIDFQAGVSIRVALDPSMVDADIESVRSALTGLEGAQVQTVGTDEEQQFIIRLSDPGNVDSFNDVASREILGALSDAFGENAVEELSNNFVGPRFSQDLTRNTVLLTGLALTVILVYIWFRFKLAYAFSAIIALLHDVSFMLGFIGTMQIEVSTATIAAVLTIIGYSLNDTIVIFDRIRENTNVMRESGFANIINTSITQSLSRTLITSLTTLLAVLAIYIFATGSVQLFALNLIIGVVVGTYSSIFIASPVLLGWQRGTRRRRAKKDSQRHGTPMTARTKEDVKTASPQAAATAEITAEEKERMINEISRKKSASGGKSGSRAKRKKKK